MSLTVWTKTVAKKVFHNLAPVLRNVDLPVHVVNDFSVPEGTQVILALGSTSLRQLADEKIVAKNRTTTSYRTVPLMRQGVPVLLSYSPDIGEIDHGYYVDLLTDTSLAARYCLTGKWKPTYGEYRYVHDFSELVAGIKAQYEATQQPVDISVDLETLGLDPFALPTFDPPHPGAYIVTIQATYWRGKADVIRFNSRDHERERLADPVLREQIDFLLNCPYIRLKGADFKYDMGWLWERGHFTCTTFTFDTTIVGSLLDENRSNSLDAHVKIYVPTMAGYSDEFDRTVKKDRMDLVPLPTMLPYAGGDVDADIQVATVMKKELMKDQALTRFYVNILHPAARAFEGVHQCGMLVDQDAYKELKADLEAEHIKLVTQACKIMGGRIVAKHGNLARLGGMNLTKASMLCDFMFSPMGLNLKPKMFTEKPDKDGIKRPSTAMEHLLMFEDVPEAQAFVKIIKEDSSVMKTYDTYVIGFLEHIRSDGRFHPNFFMFRGNREEGEGGTNTGRLSAKGPAFQTIPKFTTWAKRIRRCFPAPPGYVVVERDYSQGELRVGACIADETNMIAAYKAGRDLHVETAAVRWGMTYEELMAMAGTDPELFENKRQPGKVGNFGLLFGMGVDGFVIYAWTTYGVVLTWAEADEFRTGFFNKYPKLTEYHQLYKAMAHRDKQVRTPLGRVRHLPLIDSPNREFAAKAERQAINSPIQGTLTDLVLWAISIEHKAGLQSIAPCWGACHDSIYNYVPEDRVEEVVTKGLDIMENLPFEQVKWNPQLQFVADAKYGPNLGDLKKFKRGA